MTFTISHTVNSAENLPLNSCFKKIIIIITMMMPLIVEKVKQEASRKECLNHFKVGLKYPVLALEDHNISGTICLIKIQQHMILLSSSMRGRFTIWNLFETNLSSKSRLLCIPYHYFIERNSNTFRPWVEDFILLKESLRLKSQLD